MSWLSAPLRWPDAVLGEWDSPLVDVVEKYRHRLPSSTLRSLPAPLLVVFTSLIGIAILSLLVGVLRPTPRSHKVLASSSNRKRKTGPRTVLLLGPTESGKTSIFSALVYGTIPRTHTSQRESQGNTILGPPPPLPGQELSVSSASSASVPVHLVDLPGHPRLRGSAQDYLSTADAIVFCVDATKAARATTATTSQVAAEGLADAIDFFHSTMTLLANRRLKANSGASSNPPSLQVLFTRSDLSPLLASTSSENKDPAQFQKRRAQLLQRAKLGFETELARRRTALQLGRRSATGAPKVTRIGGIGKVHGTSAAGGAGGLVARLQALLGLGATTGSGDEKDYNDDQEEAEEEDFDYVDWSTLQAQAKAAAGGMGAATNFSLEKLDEDVVHNGKAEWGLISLGRERDWLSGSGAMKEGKDDRDLRAFLTSL